MPLICPIISRSARTSADLRARGRLHAAQIIESIGRDLAAVAHPPVKYPDPDRLVHEVPHKPEVMRQSLRVDALSIPGGIHDMISLLSGKLHQIVSMAGMVSQQGQIISQACGNHGLALVVA